MKTLYIVRHAKAVSRILNIPDFERSLVKKGIKDAKLICAQLKIDEIIPELLISSPANRAFDTAKVFAKVLGHPVRNIILEKDIYDSRYSLLLRLIKKLDDKYKTAMLFGHDPSISEIVMYLTKDFTEYLPKTGMVCINFNVYKWHRISKGKGTLRSIYYPVDIIQKSENYKIIRQELESEILDKLHGIMKEKEIAPADAEQKIIKKTAKKLAKKIVLSIKQSHKK